MEAAELIESDASDVEVARRFRPRLVSASATAGAGTSARASPKRAAPGWPLVLVWDNLNTRVSRAVSELAEGARDWLTVFQFPPSPPNATRSKACGQS